MRRIESNLLFTKYFIPSLLICALLARPDETAAATYYVAPGGDDTAAGTNWATAVQTIQAAVDLTVAGDLVLVSNGVYQTGGRVAGPSALTNRVVIDKPITVQSVNGPGVTTIRGAWHPITTNGNAAVRCVWMTNGATLTGFTLTNGATRVTGTTSSEQSGGGLWAQSAAAVVSNCVVTGNAAGIQGGGAFDGTLNHCSLTGNSATNGGGAYGSTLNHCALTGNSAESQGGGANNSTLNNCVLTGNTAPNGGGAYFSTLNNCMLTGNSASNNGGGANNSTLNNCTLTGNSAGSQGGGADNSWLNNCIAYFNDAPTGPNVSISQINNTCTTPFPLGGAGNITNDPQFVSLAMTNLQLAAGSPCINAGNNSLTVGATDLADNPRIAFGTVDMGAYEYQGPAIPPGSVLYVALNNPTPVSPYATWSTAATNIQDGIDAAINGITLLVSNGVYETGGRVAPGSLLTNRVIIDKPIKVWSVNGPHNTFIVGAGPMGDAAVRCVWITNGASLSGFTVMNGATRSSGDLSAEQSGGGLWAQSGLPDISNCILTGNTANNQGGGAFRATLTSCSLIGNASIFGGGAHSGFLIRCTLIDNVALLYGGGAYGGTLNSGTVSGNSAVNGGGTYSSFMNNVTVSGNAASSNGGGAFGGTLNNCTLTGNSAGNQGGGTFESTLNNCIVYFSTAPNDPNYFSGTINYTCTTPMPAGTGNITNDPQFVDLATTNLQLTAGSPCRDMGNNASAPFGPDTIGSPRIVHVYVDMGAYEFQGSPPGDYDGDGMSNTDERIAGSDPLDADDVWRILETDTAGSLSFNTRTGRVYAADYNDDLMATPQIWTEHTNNIPGTGSAIEIMHTSGATNRNYRVRVGLAP
ncbi:MAG TPA: choice-of-anchor Q domain-containing protein [Kiritimatiellia bacterium]|nr:choice-of-anchor Q domain-containing protein [Kiritimatiellia bacterium]